MRVRDWNEPLYCTELLSEGVKRLGNSVAGPGWMNRVAPICLRDTRKTFCKTW